VITRVRWSGRSRQAAFNQVGRYWIFFSLRLTMRTKPPRLVTAKLTMARLSSEQMPAAGLSSGASWTPPWATSRTTRPVCALQVVRQCSLFVGSCVVEASCKTNHRLAPQAGRNALDSCRRRRDHHASLPAGQPPRRPDLVRTAQPDTSRLTSRTVKQSCSSTKLACTRRVRSSAGMSDRRVKMPSADRDATRCAVKDSNCGRSPNYVSADIQPRNRRRASPHERRLPGRATGFSWLANSWLYGKG